MAETMTYDSLLVDLRRYLERGWTADDDPNVYQQLPRLINLSERRCARELKVLGIQEVVTSTMQADLAVYAKPDRWKQTISINFGTGTGNNTRNIIFPRSLEYIRMYWPDQTATDAPEFYADYNYSNWLFAPTPDAAYPFEVVHYAQPPFLDDTNQTNWLTDWAPGLLLYGSLLEATPFLKNDERISIWQGSFDRDLASTNGEDIQKILDRSVERRGD